jgi:hypothetical protein
MAEMDKEAKVLTESLREKEVENLVKDLYHNDGTKQKKQVELVKHLYLFTQDFGEALSYDDAKDKFFKTFYGFRIGNKKRKEPSSYWLRMVTTHCDYNFRNPADKDGNHQPASIFN